jgi:hypothetical protein
MEGRFNTIKSTLKRDEKIISELQEANDANLVNAARHN